MRLPAITTTIQTAVTIALGGIGGSAGFIHTHDWAMAHGQQGWLAWADAVVIEGMAVVAGFEIHRDHTAHRAARKVTLPQVVLVVAFLIQMTAQVSQAEKSPEGWLLAAMPALGFLTVVKLAMRRIPAEAPATTPDHGPPQATTPAASSPASRPTGVVVDRLPVPVRQSLITAAGQAHQDGRAVTADDVRRTITLAEPMLTNVVRELNNTINHHALAEKDSR